MVPADAKPILSICIPTFNRGDFLQTCLSSVVSELQKNPDAAVEVVVSDNASTDDTESLCRGYQKKCPAIQYFRNPRNIGTENFEAVIEHAEGEYCWFLGDDDAMAPGALRCVLDALKERRDIYLSWATETDADFQAIERTAYWYTDRLTRFTYDLGNEADLLEYMSQCKFMAGLFAFMSILIFRRDRWMEQQHLRETWTWTHYPHQISLLGMTRARCLFRFLPNALVYKRLGNDRFAVAAPWERLYADIRAWGEFGREIFGDRPRLRAAFYQVARRNHPEGIEGILRNTQDEKAWGEAREWLLEIGYEPRAIAAVEEGWDLLTQKRRASRHLDYKGLCLADTFTLFRGARRVAVLTSARLGRVLLATSLLPILREAWSAEILWMVPEAFRELFVMLPSGCKVFYMDKDRFSNEEGYRRERIAAFKAFDPEAVLNLSLLRPAHLDLLIQLGAEPIASVAFLGSESVTPRQAKEFMDRQYTRLLDERGVDGTPLDALQAIARCVGAEAGLLAPHVWLGEQTVAACRAWFRSRGWDPHRTLVLAPGFAGKAQRLDSIGPAIGAFCRDKGFALALIGPREEHGFCGKVLEAAECDGVNLAGALTPGAMAAFLSEVRLTVCGDTDVAHLACAAGRPHLVICSGFSFGRVFPYSPLTTLAVRPLSCFFCDGSCPHERMHCVKDLDPDVLVRALEVALAPPGDRPTVVAQAPPSEEVFPPFLDLQKLLNPEQCRLIQVPAIA